MNKFFKSKKITALLCAVAIMLSALAIGIPSGIADENAGQTASAAAANHISSPLDADAIEYTLEKNVPQSKAVEILEADDQQGGKQILDLPNKNIELKKADLPETEVSSYSEGLLQAPVINDIRDIGDHDITNGGQNPIESVMAFINIYSDGINNFNAYLQDVEGKENIQEIVAEYDNDEGEHFVSYTGIYYDTATKLIYGKDGTGIFAIGYDFDLENLVIYTPVDSWQRNFGFCILYDILSPLVFMDYNTVRIKFNYGGLDWMVQIWKGRYAITMGAEIGLYSKPTDRAVGFYDCATDEQMMPMAMQLYRGKTLLFEREMQTHWWVTGFAFRTICEPWQLTLNGSIIFPEEGFRDAFTAAIDSLPFWNNVSYSVIGNQVDFIW